MKSNHKTSIDWRHRVGGFIRTFLEPLTQPAVYGGKNIFDRKEARLCS